MCDWAKYHQENIQVATTEHQALNMICLSSKDIYTCWNDLSATVLYK